MRSHGSIALSSSQKHRRKHWQMFETTREVPSMFERSSEFAAAAAIGVEEEEQKLADQCRGSFYRTHTKLIKVIMTLSNVVLVAKSTDDPHLDLCGDQKPERESPALLNVVRPVSVWPECRPKDHKPGASWLGGQLVWPSKMGLFIVIYLHYAFVKLLTLSILSLKRHIILSHLKPSLQPQAPRTNGCALSEDLVFSKPAERAQLEQLKSLDAWLKFLGLGMTSSPEFSVPFMFLLAILPVFYHHMRQQILSLNRHRSDTLCFMLDPLGERRRIGAELRNIVHELILSQSNHKNNLYYGLENSETLQDPEFEVFGLPSLRRLRASFGCTELAASRRELVDDQVRRLLYLQTLFKIRQLKQVDPYIVTAQWHRTLLRQTNRIFKTAICNAIVLAIMTLLGALLYDLCDATRLRLEMVECTKWRPQGGTRIVALDHLYLDELKSEEQLDAYKAHDGSTLSLLKLALFVEATNYFSLRRLINWSECLLSGTLLISEVFVSTSLQLTSASEKITWLNQLDQQVDRAAKQAAEHAHLARRVGSTQEEDNWLLDTLTLVYLNYELFRRQQNEYLMLTDPITTCISTLSMMNCLIIYYSGVNLGGSSQVLILYFCSRLLIQINLFLVASSYRLKQMEKIMTKATRILAHCSSGPIQLSYPVELWRRQVRDFGESWWCYASRMFGIYVTYENVISLNGYAAALVLILLKPQQNLFY